MINTNSYLIKIFDERDRLEDALIECDLVSILNRYANYVREKRSFRILFVPLDFEDDGYIVEENGNADVLLGFDCSGYDKNAFQTLSGNSKYQRDIIKEALMRSEFKYYINKIGD